MSYTGGVMPRRTQSNPSSAGGREAGESGGLGPELEVPRLTPALQPADLETGCVARYISSEQRKSKGFDRQQFLHTFQLAQAHGAAKFALWGAVQLDMKLRNVTPGSIVLLQYQGRDATRDRAPHLWSVRPFHGNSQELATLLEGYAAGGGIVAEAVGVIEARTSGSDFADDDLPF